MTNSENLNKISSRPSESGQILVFALMLMVVLVVAIFLLFDLHTVIRTKIKAQTGVDSAAMTAAKWQRESLNLIGELNLVKACTVLITDMPPYEQATTDFDALTEEDQLDILHQKSYLISEMQSRVSFVGPMLGFAAAQQAAKNNGLPVRKTYNRAVEMHIDFVNNDALYGSEAVSQELPYSPGYEWREPYLNLLENVLLEGVSTIVNSTFLGNPRVNSDAAGIADAILNNEGFYDAVNSRAWCELSYQLHLEDSDSPTYVEGIYDGNWWGNVELDLSSFSFIEESEYLPLYIDFYEGGAPYVDAVDYNHLNGALDLADHSDWIPIGESYSNLLNVIPWATFSDRWHSNLADEWTDGTWLKSTMQEGYNYIGTNSYCEHEFQTSTSSGFWGRLGNEDTYSSQSRLGNEIGFSVSTDPYGNYSGERLSDVENLMTSGGVNSLRVMASAKPLGRLTLSSGEIYSPAELSMILPVFDKQTIVPVLLGDDTTSLPSGMKWKMWVADCLPRLTADTSLADFTATVKGIYGDEMDYYLLALASWNDPSFRQKGLSQLNEVVSSVDVYDDKGQFVETRVVTWEDVSCTCRPTGHGHTRSSGPAKLM